MKKSFTLIEMIAAFFLVSLVISILFSQLRLTVFSQAKIQKNLSIALQEEKCYQHLKLYFNRLIVSKEYPITLEEGKLSFFFETSPDDPFEKAPIHFAVLELNKSNQVFKTFISEKEMKSPMSSSPLPQSILPLKIAAVKNKKKLESPTLVTTPDFISFSNGNDLNWVFNLGKPLVIQLKLEEPL
jgi:type II secretory pathway pseudopilin PulG